ncbi:hypothetical protein CROQUDRAFT_672097 [Cronartium quercuum f. sp. fusiforme G11]|uniref:Uncharacterized protein n=1 Tax=Cronartium quercuum f. sp. fusiforme G11 TaxID=708437 RepID=A0A9P6NDQ6_9BASI|nr:hypothetical protein CROQUDRAFT_672097 [Cronartium quercuum f. sp. fusiforme G11]
MNFFNNLFKSSSSNQPLPTASNRMLEKTPDETPPPNPGQVRKRNRPSALDLDVPLPPPKDPEPPITNQTIPLQTTPRLIPLEIPEKIKSNLQKLTGQSLIRSLLNPRSLEIKPVEEKYIYIFIVKEEENGIKFNLKEIMPYQIIAKVLWGPGKREISKAIKLTYGQINLSSNLIGKNKEGWELGLNRLESYQFYRIEFMNESVSQLAITNLQYILNQKILLDGFSVIAISSGSGDEVYSRFKWIESPGSSLVENVWNKMKKPEIVGNFKIQSNRPPLITQTSSIENQQLQTIPIPVTDEPTTKLEIIRLPQQITIEEILKTLLNYRLLPLILPHQLKLSQIYQLDFRNLIISFEDSIDLKISLIKISEFVRDFKKKKLVKDLFGFGFDVVPFTKKSMESEDQWNIWEDAIVWDQDRITEFAEIVASEARKKSISSSKVHRVISNVSSDDQTNKTIHKSIQFKLPSISKVYLVELDNLPILENPAGSTLRSFLLSNVIRLPSPNINPNQFFPIPFSVHLGKPNTNHYPTAILVFKVPSLSGEPDNDFLKHRLISVIDWFNNPKGQLEFERRKLYWSFVNDNQTIYYQLKDSREFDLVIFQEGVKKRKDREGRYGDFLVAPGCSLDLSRLHRRRTNSNAPTIDSNALDLLTDDSDDVEESDNDRIIIQEEDQNSEEEGQNLTSSSFMKSFKKLSTKEELEERLKKLSNEINFLEFQKGDEKIEELENKSEAFQIANEVSEKRSLEIIIQKQDLNRLKRKAAGKRKRKSKSNADDDDDSGGGGDEGLDLIDGNLGVRDIDALKKKKRIKRMMQEKEPEPDHSGIITNPNFIIDEELMRRKFARPNECEPGEVL